MSRLHVISFNVRCSRVDATSGPAPARPGDPDHWPDRVPVLTEHLRSERPTVLGLQEPYGHQLAMIERALPEHRVVGYGREGGSHGEYSAILYDAAEVEVLEWDQLWLSDTPKVIGSTSWGNTIPRIVVWARMRSLTDGAEFVTINTHLDHRSERARVAGAAMIIELRSLFPDLPYVVTGDFNTPARDSATFKTFTDSGLFSDSWDRAAERVSPEWGTFPNYGDPSVGGPRIDWVLVTDGVEVHRAGITPVVRDGRHASDHIPVHAEIEVRPRS